jgi:phosphopantothenoylcysteine synthetase/decarboxylase
VLPELRRLARPPARLVAYRLLADAGADELEREGRRLLEEVGADWVVANDVATMGAPETSAMVLSRRQGRRWLRGPKAEVAGKLLDDLGQEIADLAPGSMAPSGRIRRGSAARRRVGRSRRRSRVRR